MFTRPGCFCIGLLVIDLLLLSTRWAFVVALQHDVQSTHAWVYGTAIALTTALVIQKFALMSVHIGKLLAGTCARAICKRYRLLL